MASSLTIAILAGGAATRLGGRDKGLQPLLGRPLLAWAIEAARAMDDACLAGAAEAEQGRPSRVLVVANRHLDEYRRHAETISDALPGHHGPLAGIAAALAVCRTPWLLTLPVDCPRPPRDLAVRFLAFVREVACDAVVAHDGERSQPLFALYRRELAESASMALAQGQGPARWQRALGARELDFADRRSQFLNLNTPEDFAAHAAERPS